MNNKKSRLQGQIVYLCGPIDQSLSDGYGKEWRNNITPFLHNLGCGVINPLDKPTDNPEDQEDENFVQYINSLKEQGDFELAQQKLKRTVRFDLRAIDLCGICLVNLRSDIHLAGTYVELTTAFLQRKPVVIHIPDLKDIPNFILGLIDLELVFTSWKQIEDYFTHLAYDENVDDIDGKFKFLDYDRIFRNINRK